MAVAASAASAAAQRRRSGVVGVGGGGARGGDAINVCLADCVHCKRVKIEQRVRFWPTVAVCLDCLLEPIDGAAL